MGDHPAAGTPPTLEELTSPTARPWERWREAGRPCGDRLDIPPRRAEQSGGTSRNDTVRRGRRRCWDKAWTQRPRRVVEPNTLFFGRGEEAPARCLPERANSEAGRARRVGTRRTMCRWQRPRAGSSGEDGCGASGRKAQESLGRVQLATVGERNGLTSGARPRGRAGSNR